MAKGNLIVIEGIDGCGKTTTLNMLEDYMRKGGFPYQVISYPKYESEAGKLIKQYLECKLSLTVYQRIALYAADRYFDYLSSWRTALQEGKTVIAARYVTSSLIYAGAGSADAADEDIDADECERTQEKIRKLEYEVMGLPEPDMVFYLTAPNDVLAQRRKGRAEQSGDTSKNIHEDNMVYLNRCARIAEELYKSERWIKIDTTEPLRNNVELMYNMIVLNSIPDDEDEE